MNGPADQGKEEVRLLCDGTLGALCRWLRAAGYDTGFLPPQPRSRRDVPAQARALRETATRERRLVLTRSRRIQEELGPQAVLVEDDVVYHQILDVTAHLDLPLTFQPLTRCREDNGVLVAVDISAVRAQVPPYVAATQQAFVQCPGCGRVYWGATHRDSMLERLEELERQRRHRRSLTPPA